MIEQENDPRTKRSEIRFYVKKSDFYEYQKMYEQRVLKKRSVNLLARGGLSKLYNDANAVLIRKQQKKKCNDLLNPQKCSNFLLDLAEAGKDADLILLCQCC